MSTHSKTIIHVVQHLSPGGLEALALNMLAFSNPKQKVIIISLEGTKQKSISKWSKLEAVENQLIFLNKPSGYSIKTLVQLFRLFRTLKPSVVHTHHIGPILYGSIAARLAGVKARIHTEHDAWHLSNQKHRSLQNFALKIAKPRIVADAALVRKQIHHHFDYQDVTVIRNGIDCEQFMPGSKQLARQVLRLPADNTIIGTAGRLEKVKGHDVLIDALTLLPNHIELVIAGDGSLRAKLEAQVKQLGISHRVTFLGLVDDMTRFYQALDLFCLPSRSEGFPLSTLEAQSCDIVTLASNVGATNETLCPKTGQLFESENPQALAASVSLAIEKKHTDSPRCFVLHNNDIRDMMKAYEMLAEEKSA
ncbi:glycosyltransferase [Vibrio bivalvicida]|uniref:Glycosyltransferase n=1 Tax=Vibrio bivalvicida TaxID=1276888 RepID=A0ABV4MJV6_9VIBR